MNAVTELMQFHRNANETIDALLVRYMSLRYKAQQGGGGQMSWEMYSWLLLRACGVNQNQLLNILQPLQGRFPNNEQEFNSMELTLRRMGHILENAPMNLASQLRAPPTTRHYLASFGERFEGQPPWNQEDMGGYQPPNGGQYLAAPATNTPSSSSSAWVQQAHGIYQPVPGQDEEEVTDTDTATESSSGRSLNYNDAEFQGMTAAQVDEHLWWAYSRAKRKWRRHLRTPTRSASSVMKRHPTGK